MFENRSYPYIQGLHQNFLAFYRVFRFRAELVPTANQDYSSVLAESDSEISLINGGTHTIENLPVNARLRITELDTLDYNVAITSEQNSENLSHEPRVFEFIIPESGDTITYTNDLRAVKVEFYSYDEHNQPLRDASFRVSGQAEESFPEQDGSFYTKDPMYFSTITVTQEWCDDVYEKITEPMHFTLRGTDSTENDGTEIVADTSNYKAVYDSSTQTWRVYIYTYEKQVAPTGVSDTPAGALALTALLSFLFCAAFVTVNCRRKEVE